MKIILTKIKVNYLTYLFFLLSFLCGYFKPLFFAFFIVFIHEMGHVLIIKLLKYKIKKIEFYPFGGITKISKPLNSSINHELLISIGGITSQIILAGILYYLHHLGYISNYNYNLLITYNSVIIIFNLLPIYPLDGLKIITAILEKFFPYIKCLKLTCLISFLTYIIFLIYNIIFSYKNYLMCLFLLFQFLTLLKQQKYLRQRFLLERYLHQYPYKKINNEQVLNIELLKKNTLHFFKYKNRFFHEKALLKQYFKD